MLDKRIALVGYSAERRRFIAAWLTVYSEEALQLCIEGAAADAYVHEHRHLSAIERIFEDAARIDHYIERGLALREAVERQEREASLPADAVLDRSLEVAAAALERFRVMAAQMRGRHG